MRKELKEKWLEALRSGKYKQGQGEREESGDDGQKQRITKSKSRGNGQKQKGAIERQRDNGEKQKDNKKAP